MKTFACMAAALVAAASAHAQSTITLFGQQYRVDRFDYSQQVTWPSVRNPGEALGLVELEGVCYAGNNRFFGSSEAMAEVFVGPPGGLVELKNHIVEFQLLESGGIPTGLQYVRTLLTNDFDADGFELAPSGLTINAGSAGPGAGGNLVVGTSEENIRAFSLQPATAGQLIPALPGQVCTPAGGNCDISFIGQLTDIEDLAWTPAFGSRAAAIYLLNQEFPDAVLRLNNDGTLNPVPNPTPANVGSFVVGGDVPSAPFATPKGLTYLADSVLFPALINRPGGTLLVGLDDDNPGLQVFDFDGNLLGVEWLLDNNVSRLPLGDDTCALLIESLAADPLTGRFFIVNQGDGATCNVLWVLSPIVAAPARCNAADIANDDGSPLPPIGTLTTNNGVTEGDYNLFFANFFDALPVCDIANDDGSPLPPFGTLTTNNGVTEADYNLFFAIYFDGCSL